MSSLLTDKISSRCDRGSKQADSFDVLIKNGCPGKRNKMHPEVFELQEKVARWLISVQSHFGASKKAETW